jgi:glycosyltransferase involved in cell wall biosynthesis
LKITYTATNRSHHYPYATSLHRHGALHAFVAGFSRLSPRSALPEIGSRLKRHDFLQTLFVLSDRAKLPQGAVSFLDECSHQRLDHASYRWAAESDAFVYYRTTGRNTARRLHREGSKTLCILEEVNTHVSVFHEILREEYEKLGLGKYQVREPAYRRLLECYDEADFILCPSSFVVRSFLAKGFAPEKLMLVNFGFRMPPRADVPPPTDKTDETFRILYVGQLHYRKGLRYAIEAFRSLSHPRKEFVIVGPTTVATGLENVSIPEGVRFAGILKGDELEQAYRTASIFVLPTLEEGSALVQGEALAAGLPVVTTTHSGSDEFIRDGVEGFVVPPADSSALLDAFTNLASNPDVVAAMSGRARLAVERIGDWDVAAGKLIAAITDKLSRKAAMV